MQINPGPLLLIKTCANPLQSAPTYFPATLKTTPTSNERLRVLFSANIKGAKFFYIYQRKILPKKINLNKYYKYKII